MIRHDCECCLKVLALLFVELLDICSIELLSSIKTYSYGKVTLLNFIVNLSSFKKL